MISACLQIFKYIYKNNRWYAIFLRMMQAFIYQCQKRLSKKIIIKKLFNGKMIFLFPGNPVSSSFFYTKIPDQKEIAALRALSDQNTIFLDVGANIGAYSLLLLDKINTVYAFEAHPLTARFCKMNFLLNNISETQVVTMAVSDNNQEKFFSNKKNACPTNHIVQTRDNAICVPCITLDQFIQSKDLEDFSFIVKIDVEGYEHEVFEGAQHFLRHYHIKGIIFEKFSSQNKEIISRLQHLGFSVKALSDNNMFAMRETL